MVGHLQSGFSVEMNLRSVVTSEFKKLDISAGNLEVAQYKKSTLL